MTARLLSALSALTVVLVFPVLGGCSALSPPALGLPTSAAPPTARLVAADDLPGDGWRTTVGPTRPSSGPPWMLEFRGCEAVPRFVGGDAPFVRASHSREGVQVDHYLVADIPPEHVEELVDGLRACAGWILHDDRRPVPTATRVVPADRELPGGAVSFTFELRGIAASSHDPATLANWAFAPVEGDVVSVLIVHGGDEALIRALLLAGIEAAGGGDLSPR